MKQVAMMHGRPGRLRRMRVDTQEWQAGEGEWEGGANEELDADGTVEMGEEWCSGCCWMLQMMGWRLGSSLAACGWTTKQGSARSERQKADVAYLFGIGQPALAYTTFPPNAVHGCQGTSQAGANDGHDVFGRNVAQVARTENEGHVTTATSKE
ncbi:hypothetical protein CYMTET_15012 [Cymbomonas tetramitiformis]|uniref:Uncharacterized protein n=1 Tax=Cymbomonas tetramitiformis TaxID=36881 RepID=A0AAE0GGE2_9CHLO|nr:hypothetical protein CYMTET_15012 [Cymbomonas tetramitiformis]